MNRKQNSWKIAFLLLISIFFIASIAIIFYISSPREVKKNDYTVPIGENVFIITTTKDKLNLFFQEQLAHGSFQFFLNDYVTLEAVIPIFGRDVVLQLDLEPELYGDGDLILKERGLRVGQLTLPTETLLSLLAKTVMFPEWIQIAHQEGNIYVYVTQIDIGESYFLQLANVDLKGDEIKFHINVRN